ncbi:hypothetical protein LWM68_20145 [Niabella sp. W65]|nr:hypothetical protein [Niabella sp. W65]MCH7364868.1 hypothetical protein [Niabella sp. W65]ULT40702.1 hypothetical protein KRR40_39070 [Niabella sp. I65]
MKINSKSFKGARKKEINDYLSIVSKYGIAYTKIDFKESLSDDLWGIQ